MHSCGLISLSLVLLASWVSQAEYRVFLLELTETPAASGAPSAPPATATTPNAAAGNSATPTGTIATAPAKSSVKTRFPSNLDPQQYVGYYPLKPNQSLDYVDTWMCPGRTDYNKPYCPAPSRAPAATPTSTAPPPSTAPAALPPAVTPPTVQALPPVVPVPPPPP